MIEAKTEVQGLYKASDGILINKDEASLNKYKAERNHLRRMKMMENDLNTLKEDMAEIKNLLRGLVK